MYFLIPPKIRKYDVDSMLTDKEQKKVFKKEASQHPEKYYPVSVLNKEGFVRKKCTTCGTMFWTTNKNRDYCGDPSCSGGFNVVENNPSKHRLSYIGVWKKIVEILEPRGYKPIKRYPVVARWNPTVEFTIASIAAFQPFVITGEVEPPAKMLIIPQFCLRFGDIENVGITGSHCTGFVMIGQHVFVSPEEWNQAKYFKDIYDFLVEGVGLSKDEFVIHEDAWAGGGSYGPCLEFFSRGVELFNQVYTMFEQTPQGDRELKLKVLDMGLGQERVAWFSQGTPNMYEAVFPNVLSKLKEITKVEQDFDLYKRFSKYSAYLNIDEVEDIDKAWARVAKELNIDVETLKSKMIPMTAIYSIAEHSRALLFAISDGKLPSNVGGGYNLRVIFRRAVSFIDQFKWNIKINDVCRWHAEELYELFPEVSEHLDEVSKILDVEYRKYDQTKANARKILTKYLEKGDISEETLLTLYDSNGISPDMVIEEAYKMGKIIRKPDDFYNKVVQLHEQKEQIHQTYTDFQLNIKNDLPETIIEYWKDYLLLELKARVLHIEKAKINEKDVWAVITDKTIAYPTSGGQLHDIGTINDIKFNDAVKYQSYIVHCLEKKPKFNIGDEVTIKIDEDWRRQLAAHHTATHVINAASVDILGKHVNQASAKKTYEKAHLDITHYDSLTEEEIDKIEKKSNEIIQKNIKINSYYIPRGEAEAKYGMRLYQGGAVPGKYIRVVEIPGEDVEACGGTHMHSTGEIHKIKIIKTQKVQDGIVRITFTGGNAVDRLEKENKEIVQKISSLLKVKPDQIKERIEEIQVKSKQLQKSITKGQGKDSIEPNIITLNSTQTVKLSAIELTDDLCELLKTTPDNLESAVSKNLEEYYRLVNLLNGQANESDEKNEIESLQNGIKILIKTLSDLKPKEIIALSQNILKENKDSILITIAKTPTGLSIAGMLGENLNGRNINLGKIMGASIQKLGGKGGGRENNFQGFLNANTLEESSNQIKTFSDEIKNELKRLPKN